MKSRLTLFLFLALSTNFILAAINSQSLTLPGFNVSPYFDEQVITFHFEPEVRIHINAPSINDFDPALPVGIALFALPNGNTIEQTVGKILEPGDDWHFDIQHIGAQTRFLREHVTEYNVVTVYLEAEQKSWPAWKAEHPDHAQIIKRIAEYLKSLFSDHDPFIVLTGHSGGGRFTFSFMDAFTSIPNYVKRISFLDSNYGYEHSYGNKIIDWLNAATDNYLSVIAYNDSVALYNGEPIVSPTGGTWYRSRIMKNYMSSSFTFIDEEDDDFIRHIALDGRIKFILKKNPTQAILHTVQVERNGFIQGMVSGTDDEGVDYVYYGDRAYSNLIQTNISFPQALTIPPRSPDAITGSEFMQSVLNMSFADREIEIYNEISSGNIPNFLRELTTIETTFNDDGGTPHTIQYEVMPDYLAIGSDDDFCRIPMGPITAQMLADLFGAVMPTRKLVDNIYQNCEIKLAPVTYTPVGNQNELVPKFVEHNTAIEQQRVSAGGTLGQLTGGTKKDVVLSNKIIDPSRTHHVTIYGWHQLNGVAIQPLYNGHFNTYVDYSHGIRFLNSQFLLDGEVKDIAEILSTQNLYKILSDETGIMIQPTYISSVSLAPQKQESFGIISEGDTELKIIIDEDPMADRYFVYPSDDGVNFAQPIIGNSNVIHVTNLPPNSRYYIKIVAENSYGSSPESEVLSIITGGEPSSKVLIVNGFDRSSEGNTFNFVRQHSEALLSRSVYFESATNDAVLDGIVDLQDYAAVDYILGDESTADETFSDAEQALIKNYLQYGGKLFISGSEIAWDLDWKGSASDKSFIHNFLKIEYVADAPGGSAGTYYSANGIFGSIFSDLPQFSFDDGTHGTIDVDYPDVVKGINGSSLCLQYTGFATSYGGAGTNYAGMFNGGTVEGKIVALGIPFETIYPEDIRNNLMGKIIDFFDVPTSVENEDSENLPTEYYLSQNYPNPFNPTTKIKFSIPVGNENVRSLLKIYDILGNEVATLVNEQRSPGTYEVEFNATNLSSGVYFYSLQAGDVKINKKMILLK
jgi:type IX secretion system substrate protein